MVATQECPVFYPTMEDMNGNFEAYIQKCERKLGPAGVGKIVPPAEWQPRKDGYPDTLDLTIERPIRQHATGTRGLYRALLVEAKPMSLRDEFRPSALDKDNLPPAKLTDPLDIERCYWRNVTMRPPLYGADVAGSLFDEDLKGWSLRNLDTTLTRVLAEAGHSLPGVSEPYLYFGQWRSTFAWHTEDVDLYSVNYLHFGAPKQWYCIPPAHRARFELVVKGLVPEFFRACHEFFRHKELIISPQLLDSYYIPYIKVLQHPREFIINFPGAYHAGFNHGYNCAESVNFATKKWIPLGAVADHCDCNPDSVTIDMRLFRHLVPARLLPEDIWDDSSSSSGSGSDEGDEDSGGASEIADGTSSDAEAGADGGEGKLKRKRKSVKEVSKDGNAKAKSRAQAGSAAASKKGQSNESDGSKQAKAKGGKDRPVAKKAKLADADKEKGSKKPAVQGSRCMAHATVLPLAAALKGDVGQDINGAATGSGTVHAPRMTARAVAAAAAAAALAEEEARQSARDARSQRLAHRVVLQQQAEAAGKGAQPQPQPEGIAADAGMVAQQAEAQEEQHQVVHDLKAGPSPLAVQQPASGACSCAGHDHAHTPASKPQITVLASDGSLVKKDLSHAAFISKRSQASSPAAAAAPTLLPAARAQSQHTHSAADARAATAAKFPATGGTSGAGGVGQAVMLPASAAKRHRPLMSVPLAGTQSLPSNSPSPSPTGLQPLMLQQPQMMVPPSSGMQQQLLPGLVQLQGAGLVQQQMLMGEWHEDQQQQVLRAAQQQQPMQHDRRASVVQATAAHTATPTREAAAAGGRSSGGGGASGGGARPGSARRLRGSPRNAAEESAARDAVELLSGPPLIGAQLGAALRLPRDQRLAQRNARIAAAEPPPASRTAANTVGGAEAYAAHPAALLSAGDEAGLQPLEQHGIVHGLQTHSIRMGHNGQGQPQHVEYDPRVSLPAPSGSPVSVHGIAQLLSADSSPERITHDYAMHSHGHARVHGHAVLQPAACSMYVLPHALSESGSLHANSAASGAAGPAASGQEGQLSAAASFMQAAGGQRRATTTMAAAPASPSPPSMTAAITPASSGGASVVPLVSRRSGSGLLGDMMASLKPVLHKLTLPQLSGSFKRQPPAHTGTP